MCHPQPQAILLGRVGALESSSQQQALRLAPSFDVRPLGCRRNLFIRGYLLQVPFDREGLFLSDKN